MAKSQTKPSKKTSTFSYIKLLVGLSFALNLAFVVFLVTLFKTTYFDMSLNSMLISRDLDKDGCYKIIKIDDSATYKKACNTYYLKDSKNIIVAPDWLKGQKAPIY